MPKRTYQPHKRQRKAERTYSVFCSCNFKIHISKKVLKSAVGRNRIRRRVYEAIRAELPNFPHPYDCLFVIYNKSILRLPFSELRTLIHDLLQRTLA